MKFLPDKHEILALAAVWLIWPAVRLASATMLASLRDFSGPIPLTSYYAFQIAQAKFYSLVRWVR